MILCFNANFLEGKKMTMSEAAYLEKCRACLAAEQAQSLAETDHWSHVDKARVHEDWKHLYQELSSHIGTSSPDSVEVQTLMAKHYDIACRFYRPSKEAYIGMSLFYCENQDMRAYHNTYHPDMVEFLELAMRKFADINL